MCPPLPTHTRTHAAAEFLLCAHTFKITAMILEKGMKLLFETGTTTSIFMLLEEPVSLVDVVVSLTARSS